MLSSQTRDEVRFHQLYCHHHFNPCCQPQYHHQQGELCRNGEAEGARADHREPAEHLRGEAGRAHQARRILEEEGTVSQPSRINQIVGNPFS